MIPIALLQPLGSRSREGLIVPVISGPDTRVPGVYGEAWGLEEATTNLIPNPGFETSEVVEGYGSHGAPSTYARTLDAAFGGAYSLHIVTSVVDSGFALPKNRYTASPGADATFSFYAKGSGTITIQAFGVRADGVTGTASGIATVMVSLSQTWTRFTLTKALPELDTVYVCARVLSNTATLTDFYLDAIQLETKNHTTSFVIGTRAPGTIAVPYTGALGSVLIRNAENGIPATAHITGPGSFGQYGTVALTNGQLTIGTTRQTTVESVLAYNTVISNTEAQRVLAMPQAWSWSDFLLPAPGVLRIGGADQISVMKIGK